MRKLGPDRLEDDGKADLQRGPNGVFGSHQPALRYGEAGVGQKRLTFMLVESAHVIGGITGRAQGCRVALGTADGRRGGDSGKCVVDINQRCDALGHQLPCRLLAHAFGQGRDHGGAGVVRPGGLAEDLHGHDPVGAVGARVGREVEHQHGEIEAAGEHGEEGVIGRVAVAPDEGVVVERVGDLDILVERGANPLRRDRGRDPERPVRCRPRGRP